MPALGALRRAHRERGTHDVVVVAFGRVDEEVHRAVRAIRDAFQLRLALELAILRRAVAAVQLQPPAVGRREQLEAKLGLAPRRELHLVDARRAERDRDQPRGRLAEPCRIDGNAADAPDVAQQID